MAMKKKNRFLRRFWITFIIISLVFFLVYRPTTGERVLDYLFGAIPIGIILSLGAVGGFYLMELIVTLIHHRFGSDAEERIKCILIGSLLFNMLPIFAPAFWAISGLSILSDIYFLPIQLVNTDLAQIFPFVFPSMFLTVPFWTIVGGIVGLLAFQLRRWLKYH